MPPPRALTTGWRPFSHGMAPRGGNSHPADKTSSPDARDASIQSRRDQSSRASQPSYPPQPLLEPMVGGRKDCGGTRSLTSRWPACGRGRGLRLERTLGVEPGGWGEVEIARAAAPSFPRSAARATPRLRADFTATPTYFGRCWWMRLSAPQPIGSPSSRATTKRPAGVVWSASAAERVRRRVVPALQPLGELMEIQFEAAPARPRFSAPADGLSRACHAEHPLHLCRKARQRRVAASAFQPFEIDCRACHAEHPLHLAHRPRRDASAAARRAAAACGAASRFRRKPA